MDIADRIAVLDFGVKIGDGTPEEISKNPKVVSAYLGLTGE
jgi:branched-chain amino acid transport system ATP-binding protein